MMIRACIAYPSSRSRNSAFASRSKSCWLINNSRQPEGVGVRFHRRFNRFPITATQCDHYWDADAPASSEHPPVALPQTLGPLRSVQPARLDGKEVLLVGARSGVIVYDPESKDTQEYADPSIDSPLGFSRAITWDGQIWGCHGDAGVVAWKFGEFAAPGVTLRQALACAVSGANRIAIRTSRFTP